MSDIQFLPQVSRSEERPFSANPTSPRPALPRAACRSVGERPDPELLFADLPEPRKAVRLDDQEEDDESPDDDKAQVLDGVRPDREPEGIEDRRQDDPERDRQHEDQSRPEERADQAA